MLAEAALDSEFGVGKSSLDVYQLIRVIFDQDASVDLEAFVRESFNPQHCAYLVQCG